MGFLSGAYGKIMAGKYLRTLQHKETMVQARLRRVTKQSARFEKMLNAQQKQAMTMMRSGSMGALNMVAQDYGLYSNQTIDQRAMMMYNQAQTNIQQQMAMEQSRIEAYFEMQREMMLEPMKEEEDAIQTELDSLKSQIQLAQAEYDAKKEEEKQGAKNIAPDYTGQG